MRWFLVIRTTFLLTCSNVFMTFAWYSHLRNWGEKKWYIAAVLNWGIAFFEYLFQVPANRAGYTTLSLPQLKVLREVITLSVFAPFAILYMHQAVKLDYVWAGVCLLGAVYFMEETNQSSRREFIKAGGIFIAASGVATAGNAFAKEEEKRNEEVSPPEDLMREHGVLKRILLAYGEALRRVDANEDLPPETLLESAKIIREFIEDYHEKLEENFLFPRFRKANKLVDLVDVLLQQHQAGRRVTDITMQLATNRALKNADDRRKLADSLRQFIRMYNPHEAREDTVLFPAFRGIVSAHEFDSLGEDFEKKEDELFGEDGFFKVVDRVAEIEKRLGIYDLAQFTPKA